MRLFEINQNTSSSFQSFDNKKLGSGSGSGGRLTKVERPPVERITYKDLNGFNSENPLHMLWATKMSKTRNDALRSNKWSYETDLITKLWKKFHFEQQERCALTGRKFTATTGTPGYQGGSGNNSPSLDRINSNGPYTSENTQWVITDINWIKRHYKNDVFIQLCKDIATHVGKSNDAS